MHQVSLNRSNYYVQWSQVIVELIIFVLLPPIIGLPLVIYRAFQYKSNNNTNATNYIAFMMCIAAYLAAINATKAPGGDQVNYFVAYKNVPEQGFIGSLIHIYGLSTQLDPEMTKISGEFMNGVYNYIGYYLTFGYYPLFAAIFTFMQYFLIFIGLYNFCQCLRKPHIPIVAGCLIIAFFYLFFNLTMQIQKQFMAQCIMMYVIGKYANTGKMDWKLWIIVGIAIFTHAATGLFLPLLLYKPLRENLHKKSIIILGGIFFLFVFLGPQLAGNITSDNSSTLSYGLSRLAASEGAKDGASLNEEDMLIRGMNVAPAHLIVIGFPILFIVLKSLFLNRKRIRNGGENLILNIVLLLLLSIIAMTNQPTAQYRYFMMLYAFMPFIYPFAFQKINQRNNFLKLLSVIMIAWFYLDFEKIIWHYAPEIDIILKSPILLIFSNYHNL